MAETSSESTTSQKVARDEDIHVAASRRDEDLVISSLKAAATALAGIMGKNCEVVVHDLRQPESSIVALHNSHVSGRRLGGPLIGGPINDVALRWLSSNKASPPRELSYDTTTADGRRLKSTTTLYYNTDGKAFGALCLNLDISGALSTLEWLEGLLRTESPSSADVLLDTQSADFTEVLDGLIQETLSREAPDGPKELSREERLRVVTSLESRGAFLMRGAVIKVAEALQVSKFTVYGYLDEIRSN